MNENEKNLIIFWRNNKTEERHYVSHDIWQYRRWEPPELKEV